MSTTATHCVLCGFDAVLAPRVHLRDLAPGAPAREVTLGLCEVHGGRLRKGELRVLMVIESWLTAENRLSPNNPLHGLRVIAHCLACDAPLEVAGQAAGARTLPGGELVVECPGCPMHNVVEAVGGDSVAVRLWQPAPRPRP